MKKRVKPIFILGLPWSGTSLLLTILSMHNYLDLKFDKDILTTFDPAKLSGNLLDPNIFKYGKKRSKNQ